MDKAKLDDIDLHFGIDTIQVKSETEGALTKNQAPFLSKNPIQNIKNHLYSYILNPDIANGNDTVLTYDQYLIIYDYMINELGIKDPLKTRIDFRFDNYDDDFNKNLKLNKVLILLIAEKYRISNKYESVDLLTQENLSLRIQNYQIEIECYNKEIQEPGSKILCRIEFRSKKIGKNSDEVSEFNRWIERLNAAATKENLIRLQDEINTALYQRYQEQKSERGFSVNAFLYKYKSSIFTSNQVADLYKRFEFKDPIQQAKKLKKRKNFEYISLKDIQMYIQKIKASADKFFQINNI